MEWGFPLRRVRQLPGPGGRTSLGRVAAGAGPMDARGGSVSGRRPPPRGFPASPTHGSSLATVYLLDLSHPPGPDFRPINDTVMGGRSISRWRRTAAGIGIFEGVVSLANNGGFASVRAGVPDTDLSRFSGLSLRCAGDGKRYRLVLRNDRGMGGTNHMQDFDTRPGEWMDVVLPFAAFQASVRGFRPPNAPPVDRSRIRQVGFMIADGQEGPFRLEVQSIRGVG